MFDRIHYLVEIGIDLVRQLAGEGLVSIVRPELMRWKFVMGAVASCICHHGCPHWVLPAIWALMRSLQKLTLQQWWIHNQVRCVMHGNSLCERAGTLACEPMDSWRQLSRPSFC